MATYSNPFQTSYNPQLYPYQYPQMNILAQQQNNPMIWVKGQNQAEIYPQAANATVVLWDSEEDCIYIKSTDALGKPSMKILDYTIRDNTSKWEKKEESNESEKYATKQDLIEAMNKLSDQIAQLKPPANRKFEKEDK